MKYVVIKPLGGAGDWMVARDHEDHRGIEVVARASVESVTLIVGALNAELAMRRDARQTHTPPFTPAGVTLPVGLPEGDLLRRPDIGAEYGPDYGGGHVDERGDRHEAAERVQAGEGFGRVGVPPDAAERRMAAMGGAPSREEIEEAQAYQRRAMGGSQ